MDCKLTVTPVFDSRLVHQANPNGAKIRIKLDAALSPDGQRVAASARKLDTDLERIIVFDERTADMFEYRSYSQTMPMAFTPDSKTLMTASHSWTGSKFRNQLSLYEAQSPFSKTEKTLVFSETITAITFRSNEHIIFGTSAGDVYSLNMSDLRRDGEINPTRLPKFGQDREVSALAVGEGNGIVVAGYRSMQSFDSSGNFRAAIKESDYSSQAGGKGQVMALALLKSGLVLAGIYLGAGAGALVLCKLDPDGVAANTIHRFEYDVPLAIASQGYLEGTRVVMRDDDSGHLTVYEFGLELQASGQVK